MVIEANKEEALLCLQKAKQAMLDKDEPKMKRFIEKALRLDPHCDVKSFLNFGSNSHENKHQERNGPERSYSHDDHYEDSEGLRNRSSRYGSFKNKSASKDSSHNKASQSDTKPSSSTGNRPRSKSSGRNTKEECSPEELSHVERIRHCKDYYEILQISRESFEEVSLKKKYRELALKLHPDKCKAPGATEAFKALGNAYAVLSDSKKRADYDRFGADGPSPSRRHNDFYDYDVGRGFEAEMSPEDIFEMFFGGGFPSGSVYRRGRTQFHFRRHYEEPREEATLLQNILHILPLILLLVGGLLMQLLVSDPAFSLSRDSTYSVARTTRDLRVTYYVKPNFETEYRNKIRQIEQHVEDEYLNQLRMKCYKEKNHQESLLWTAKIRGDSDLWKRAQNMDLPSCKRLQEIYH